MLYNAHLLIIGLLGFGLPLQPVFADTDAEREVLARIDYELNGLKTLTRKAESQTEPNARIRFRYDWLRQDLSKY